jgi:hypothetical protein
LRVISNDKFNGDYDSDNVLNVSGWCSPRAKHPKANGNLVQAICQKDWATKLLYHQEVEASMGGWDSGKEESDNYPPGQN